MRDGSLQKRVFDVLSDQDWHCRQCNYVGIPTGQLAGGGGIQGLQRGTRSRKGLVIASENRMCPTCKRTTRQDRWTGEYRESNPSSNLPQKLQKRILEHYKYTDAIESRVRPEHELVIDHRFPMERWGAAEPSNSVDMAEDQIEAKFQLLKKDSSGNHNLLKSRACEKCIETSRRGTPFGIRFFYRGGSDWPEGIPDVGEGAEAGCVGCGWYDFATWRQALNEVLEIASTKGITPATTVVREQSRLYGVSPTSLRRLPLRE